MYRDGKAVSQDLSRAVEWFEKSAENGDADAHCELGTILYRIFRNHGNRTDCIKAVNWFKKAVMMGIDRAAELLSRIHCSESMFTESEFREAVNIYEEVVRKYKDEVPKTMIVLGKIYCEGKYGKITVRYDYENDIKEGIKLIERGITVINENPNKFNPPNPVTCYEVGVLCLSLRKKKDGTKDTHVMKLAIKLLEKAKEGGLHNLSDMGLTFDPSKVSFTTVDGFIESITMELQSYLKKMELHDQIQKNMWK